MNGIDVLFSSGGIGIAIGMGLCAVAWVLNSVLGLVKGWFNKL